MEGDSQSLYDFFETYIFQSTPSAWRATPLAKLTLEFTAFQSTPSAWRAT